MKKGKNKIRKIWKDYKMIYLMIIPVLLWYVMFCYLPIAGGLSLSFREYRFEMGI